ncbi:MAG: hypothetical protein KJ626_06650 [Verrucomicrobia bacterium]|nr:hypothetical protein [Verrucomicrobiota bacterium]
MSSKPLSIIVLLVLATFHAMCPLSSTGAPVVDVPPVIDDTAQYTAGRVKAELTHADALLKEGNVDDADELLSRILVRTDSPVLKAKAQSLRSRVYMARGDVILAAQELESAASSGALSPSQEFDLSLDLLRIYAMSWDTAKVEDVLDRIDRRFLGEDAPMHIDPDHFPSPEKTHYLLARTLWNTGRIEDALKYALPAVRKAGPWNRKASLIIARAYGALGKPALARRCLMRSVRIGGEPDCRDTSKVLLQLVRESLRSDTIGSVTTYIDMAPDVLPDSECIARFTYRAAQLCRDRGVSAWRAYMETVAKSDVAGVRVQALEELASSAKRERRWSDVADYYQRLNRLPERDRRFVADDYLHIMEALAKSDQDIEGIVKSLKEYAEGSGSDDTYSLYRVGRELENLERNADAEWFYGRVLANGLSADWGENALIRRAEVFDKMGNQRGAYGAYLRYLAAQKRQGDYVEAIHGLGKFVSSPSFSLVPDGGTDYESLIEEHINEIDDFHTLSSLVVFLQNKGQTNLAVRCLRRADCVAHSPKTPERSLEIEEMVLRRMDELGLHAEVIERIRETPLASSSGSEMPDETTADIKYHLFHSLWEEGVLEEARDVADVLLASIAEEDALFCAYAVCIGARYVEHYPELARGLFEQVLEKSPPNPYSSIATLYLAVSDIGEGLFEDALAAVDRVIERSNPDADLRWQRDVYWNAVFLRAIVGDAEGGAEKQGAIDEARSHATIWPFVEGLAQ